MLALGSTAASMCGGGDCVEVAALRGVGRSSVVMGREELGEPEAVVALPRLPGWSVEGPDVA